MHENIMLWTLIAIIFVLSISSLVYMFSLKFKLLPYTVLLTILGLLFSNFFPLDFLNNIKLTPENVLLIFLPILLFESAFNFDFREFKRIMLPGFLLATIGLLISAFFIALPLKLLLNINFSAAFMFGCIVSSTDPIAVLTIFKQLGVPKKLQLLVDGESFMNDATSIIMYKIMLNIIGVGFASIGFWDVAKSVYDFFYLFIGGLVLGAILGYIFSEIIYRIKNVSVVEITLTVLLAHLVFILAEDFFNVSGVVAVLSAGLIIGNYGRTKISPQVTENMHEVWNILVFITTSIVFFMIGTEISVHKLIDKWFYILVAIVAMLIGRSISVYSVLYGYNLFVNIKNKIPSTWMHITNWGGLRGALPLIVILSLDRDFPYKEIFLILVIGLIFFTLLINASTITLLIKVLGLDKISKINEIEVLLTETLVLKSMIKKIKILKRLKEIKDFICEEKISLIKNKIKENKDKLSSLITENMESYYLEMDKIIRKYCLQIEKDTYFKIFKRGVVPEIVYSTLKNNIDLQIERINEGQEQMNFNKDNTGSKTFKINWFDKIILFLDEEFNPEKKIISYNYKYHKLRLLGDEKVLQELKMLRKLDFLPQNVITGIIKSYKKLKKYNLKTLKEIETLNPETTKQVDNSFINAEIKYYTHELLHEFGEQERVSYKSIKCIEDNKYNFVN